MKKIWWQITDFLNKNNKAKSQNKKLNFHMDWINTFWHISLGNWVALVFILHVHVQQSLAIFFRTRSHLLIVNPCLLLTTI
jgi:hypothetical protein